MCLIERAGGWDALQVSEVLLVILFNLRLYKAGERRA